MRKRNGSLKATGGNVSALKDRWLNSVFRQARITEEESPRNAMASHRALAAGTRLQETVKLARSSGNIIGNVAFIHGVPSKASAVMAKALKIIESPHAQMVSR